MGKLRYVKLQPYSPLLRSYGGYSHSRSRNSTEPTITQQKILSVLFPSPTTANDSDWEQPDFLKYEFSPIGVNSDAIGNRTERLFGNLSEAVILNPASFFK